MPLRQQIPLILLAAAFGLLVGSTLGAVADSLQGPLPMLRQQPAWVQAIWLNLWTVGLSGVGLMLGSALALGFIYFGKPTAVQPPPIADIPPPAAPADEQAFILQVGRALSQADDLAQLGALLTLHLDGWVKPYFIEVAVLDEAHQHLQALWVMENGQRRDPAIWTLHILTQQVAHNAQPLRLQLLDMPELAAQPTLRAYLGVPLFFRKELIGVLAIGTPQLVEAFDANHQRWLTALAPWVATALVQTRTRHQLQLVTTHTQSQLQRLEKLNTALNAVATTWQMDDLIAVALEQAQQLVPYEAATFWQVLPAPLPNLRWRIAGARGQADAKERVGQVADANSPYVALFAELLANPRLLNIPDITADPRFSTLPASPTRAWLGVPLLNQGTWLGLLALEKNTAGGYASDQLEVLQTFVQSLTLALAKTQRQAEQLQRLVETEETLRRWRFVQRFAVVVHQPQGLVPILRTTLQTLAEVLAINHASAAAFDPACVQVVALEHYAAAKAAAPQAILTPPLALEIAARIQAQPQPSKTWLPNGGAKLFLPLINGDSLMGVVGVQTEARHSFTRVENELGLALAEQAALALANAHRFENQTVMLLGTDAVSTPVVVEALPFLHQLNQLAAALPKCLTPHSVLNTTVATLTAALKAEQASAVAIDRAGGWATVWVRYPEPATATPDLTDLIAFLRQQPAPLAVAQITPPVTAAHLAWVGPAVNAALFLPLLSGEDLVGLIGLPLARPLTAAELALTQACAHLAALALDNAQQQAAHLIPALPPPQKIASQPYTPRTARPPPLQVGQWAGLLALAGLGGLIILGALVFGPDLLRAMLPAPAPTASITPTVLFVPSTPVVPTPEPTATINAIVAPTITSTGTALPTVTATASPSPITPTATINAMTPTVFSTPTLAPGVVAVARVTLQEGFTARLRDEPNGAVIGVVENNMEVEVLSEVVTAADATNWVQVHVLDTNQTGWLADDLLEYLTPKPR